MSKRLRETDLICKAFYALTRTVQSNDCEFQESDEMDCFESNTDHEDILENSPLFHVNLVLESEQQQIVECLAGKSVRTSHQLHPIILNFLYKERLKKDYPLLGQTIIELWTECKRNGVMYCAHPNYNSFGEWYDWAMIQFEIDGGISDLSDEEQAGYYADNLFPSKILCFMKSEDDSIYAVIHSCYANSHEEDGILMERWKKEYKVSQNKIEPLLRCVSVDSFEEPCFVVEDRHGLFEEYDTDPIHISKGVTLVKPREKAWPEEFL